MPVQTQKARGLTGNQLKILAMVAMTIDHIGVQLLPQFGVLRIIGRLALPIYAYMIAEGCRYTHDRKKYLLRLAGLALLCQMVYFFAMGSLYMCILVTFSLSVCLIYAMDSKNTALALGALAVIGAACILLPRVIPGFDIDYGVFGVLLPVGAYFGSTRKQRLLYLTLGLILLANAFGGVQWFALAAVPILALYNGQRGRYRIGTFFYLYYPLHLVVLYGINLILK